MGQMTVAWHSQSRVDAAKLKKRLNSFPSSSWGIGALNSHKMMALPATGLYFYNCSADEHSGVTCGWHRCKSYWLNPLNSSLYFSLFFVALKEFFALLCFFSQLQFWINFLCFLPQIRPCLNVRTDYLGDYQPQEKIQHTIIICHDPGTFSPWQWMFMQITRASENRIISFYNTKKNRDFEGK